MENLSKTYFEQCQLEGLFSSFKELRSLLNELYVDTGFRTDEDTQELAMQILEKYEWTKDIMEDVYTNKKFILPMNAFNESGVACALEENLDEQVKAFYASHRDEFGKEIMSKELTEEQLAYITILQEAANTTTRKKEQAKAFRL